MKPRITAFIIFFAATALLTSCDLDVPIREMVQARSMINEALKYRADRYDPENLEKSRKALLASQSAVADGDEKKAMEKAKSASELAKAAIVTSLPLLARDTRAEAKKLHSKADSLNAGEFAPDDFSRAAELITESEKKSEEKLYRESYKLASDAILRANAAVEISAGRIPALRNEVNGLKKRIEELSTRPFHEAAEKELGESLKKAESAKEKIEARELKEAAPLITASRADLEAAEKKMLVQNAQQSLTRLRKETDQLEKERGSDFAGDDLDAIRASLNEAEALITREVIEDALNKISEADDLLKAARMKTTRGIALEKIATAEKLLLDIRSQDPGNKHAVETGKAEILLKEGRELLDADSFPESINKADEATGILNGVSVAIAGKTDRTMDSSGMNDNERVYTVKYNRKNRDCLWRIALKVYRDARLWPLIYQANRKMIKDPDLIFPGQKFIIPPVPEKGNKKQKTEADKKDKTGTPGIKPDAG